MCIASLRERSVHPYFPAYLHLRQRGAAQGTLSDLQPEWDELSTFLQVRNAPSRHPHFRPLTLAAGSSDQEWLNVNLAGSYAPSSLRAGQPPLQVVELGSGRGRLSLREKHWELARKHLLKDEKLPLIPLAGFILRDFGFETDGDEPPGNDDLEAAFVEVFGYNDADGPVELDHLYDQTPVATPDWFEPLDGGSP